MTNYCVNLSAAIGAVYLFLVPNGVLFVEKCGKIRVRVSMVKVSCRYSPQRNIGRQWSTGRCVN